MDELRAMLPQLRELAAHWGAGPDDPSLVVTRSGAWIVGFDRLVIKVHHPGTRRADLAARLVAITSPALSSLFVSPVHPAPLDLRGCDRLVTVWPRTEVLDPRAPRQPWCEAGTLLAALHRAEASTLPLQGGPQRLARAVARAAVGPEWLHVLGRRLLDQPVVPGPSVVCHGDWHLGQLGRREPDQSWRLLDVDDLGLGDGAWDLARPAGFWAAGLLDDPSWFAFLGAYQAAGGPAVPLVGDPWPVLDQPARAAVYVAAVSACSDQSAHSGPTADALLAACRRMASWSS